MNRTIILALSVAVVLLAATASTASAAFLSPVPFGPSGVPSFDFGDRQVGTTSPAQDFGLWVSDYETFNPRISVSGDYAQTNDCPPTLSAQAGPERGCLITVTFTPTGTGPRGGTLSAGPGGPTAALTGTGVTTPTPPALPLTVFVPERWNDGVFVKAKTLHFYATTSNDSTLVVRGDVRKTTTQLAADEMAEIKAKIKHQKRLYEKPRLKAKIKVAATDEFGQTASDEIKFVLRRCPAEESYNYSNRACHVH